MELIILINQVAAYEFDLANLFPQRAMISSSLGRVLLSKMVFKLA